MTKVQICPNCHSLSMACFYEFHNVPLHSNILLEDRQAAIDYPTGDLSLGFCRECAFISNTAFDSVASDLSGGYEDRQTFSARFLAYQRELVAHLVERYGLRGKNIVEVGCGKGDFLIELCEAGENLGVGIDPICECGDSAAMQSSRVRFLGERYSVAHADLACDCLCCRHTLEHIVDTGDFLRLVRDVIGNRMDSLLFFEVPDVTRVLRDLAFWDIYHEHCSYFSPASLERLLVLNGFSVLEIDTLYDNQYLMVIAKPAGINAGSHPEDRADVRELAREVDSFVDRIRKRIDGWRSRISQWHDAGDRIAIWGSGSKCVSFLSTVGHAEAISSVVDINPHRHGRFLPCSGKEVVSPESLRISRPNVILVMNPIYREEIQRSVDEMGLESQLEMV